MPRITLAVLFIGGLIARSLCILTPFLAAFIWATMIVVATWPLMRRVERAFGGGPSPAVAVMSLGLLAILIVPLGVVVTAVVQSVLGCIRLAVAYTVLDDWVSAAPIRGGFEAALATEPVGGDPGAG